MIGVLNGFMTIWVVVGVGWLLAQLKILDEGAQHVLSKVAFHAGLPCLLFGSLLRAELGRIFSTNVIVSILAIALTVTLYLIPAALRWRRDPGHLVIGSFGSAYVNANNMGLPIAAYVVGDTSWVAPILLIQVIFLQPFGLALLDVLAAKKEHREVATWEYVTLPLRNPMTVGVLLGVILNLTQLHPPQVIVNITDVIGGISVPAMLIAFGISLRLGPLPGKGNLGETIYISVLKVLVQPLIALCLARWLFHFDVVTTLAVTVMAGLPTAQNVFVFAMRAKESVQLARDVIFITSLASIPAITAYAALVHTLI